MLYAHECELFLNLHVCLVFSFHIFVILFRFNILCFYNSVEFVVMLLSYDMLC